MNFLSLHQNTDAVTSSQVLKIVMCPSIYTVSQTKTLLEKASSTWISLGKENI